ncbi:MAG: hypothetical protein KatS3mg108_3299 [Isosphaeraceae bacterium]|jgi:hypothetical protein|nr:MAG: hypothetical protein KatS3mg108_3299 [Isosphaeraceae bacterium]
MLILQAALILALAGDAPPQLALPDSAYVGQPLDAHVRDPNHPQARLTVDWPQLPWADCLPIEPARAWIIPRQSGTFLFPSLSTHRGDWTGRTRPVRVTVRPVPAIGRGPDFLGGVGTVGLSRRLVPDRIRVGQELTVEITLDGPGALATSPPPSGLGWLPDRSLAVLVESSVAVTPDPPRRTVRFRIRPNQPGPLRFPPLRVSTFDPVSRRFQTATAPGLTLDVEPPPRFDADAALSSQEPSRLGHLAGIAGAISAVALLVVLIGVLALRRIRRATVATAGPAALIQQARNWLASGPRDSQVPRGIVRHVSQILRSSGVGLPAWPTPSEAAQALAHQPELADATRSLLADCEFALFAPQSADQPADHQLQAAFARWLERIAHTTGSRLTD